MDHDDDDEHDPMGDLVEAETAPEFQVAPMVDVLLVLLLFFMATATTEVVQQSADVKLPKAIDSKDKEKGKGEFLINIESLNFTIKANGKIYDTPEDLTPDIRANAEANEKGTGVAIKDYRVMIRADEKTTYEQIQKIMQAAAKAEVINVSFAVGEDEQTAKGKEY